MDAKESLQSLITSFPDLYLVSGQDSIVDATGGEEFDFPVSEAVFMNDVTCAWIVAMVSDGKLCRFGLDSRGEDPSEVVPTTLEELVSMGHPSTWLGT